MITSFELLATSFGGTSTSFGFACFFKWGVSRLLMILDTIILYTLYSIITSFVSCWYQYEESMKGIGFGYLSRSASI